MTQVTITGYETECHCDHCGRALKHGVRISDGRLVGATCLGNKLTEPKEYNGRKYRLAASEIVRLAKVVARVRPEHWSRYGCNAASITFTGAR